LLTATIYNGDNENHITNHTPAGLDDLSASVGAMQSTTDPGEVGSESLATSIEGEIQRIRKILAEVTGNTNWYESPNLSLQQSFWAADYFT